MQTRSILIASLIHGAVIVGIGLGVQPWLMQPRPDVQVSVMPPAPEVFVSDEAAIPEAVPVPSEMADEPFVEPEFVPPPRPVAEEAAEKPPEVVRPVDRVEPRSRAFRAPPEFLIRVRPKISMAPPDAAAPSVAASFVEAEALEDKNQPPSYPEGARRRGVEGEVELLVTVGVDGAVRKVEILKSAGLTRLHRELDYAAIAAICKWLYKPARRGGKAVEARIKVPLEFRMR